MNTSLDRSAALASAKSGKIWLENWPEPDFRNMVLAVFWICRRNCRSQNLVQSDLGMQNSMQYNELHLITSLVLHLVLV